MSIIASIFVVIILVCVCGFKINREKEFMALSFGEKAESVGTSMLFICIVSLPGLLVVSIPLSKIQQISEVFSASASNAIGILYYRLLQGAFWGILFSMFLLILAIVILNGLLVPFMSYANVVKTIYGSYRIGKFYSILIQTVAKVVVIGCPIFLILLLFPQVRGEVFLNKSFEQGCLGTVVRNGSVQADNKAYLKESLFGDDWYWYVEEGQYYQRYRDGEMKSGFDFFGRNENVRTKCANIDNRLIGIIDDNHIYLRSLSGISYRTIKCDWKSKYINDGEYDYGKIFDTVESSWSERSSPSDIAAIIGLMQEKVLIGLGLDEPAAAFFEEKEDGGYFIFYTKSGVREFGAYNVDSAKPIMAVQNIALFVDDSGRFCWIDMNSEGTRAKLKILAVFLDTEGNYTVGRLDRLKKTKKNAKSVEGEIVTFNYYITDKQGVRCCVYGGDSNNLYLFSLGGDEGLRIVQINVDAYGSPENIYLSKKMGLLRFEEGWATFGGDD